MNLVFVAQVKNINVVAEPYKKIIEDTIITRIIEATKNLFCFDLKN